MCPGCGKEVPAGGRGQGKVYCTDACRRQFNNWLKTVGAPMAIFALAWAEHRHAKPGTQEAEVSRYARSQLTTIAREINEGRRSAGLPSTTELMLRMIESGSIWADRKRGPRADLDQDETDSEQLSMFEGTRA